MYSLKDGINDENILNVLDEIVEKCSDLIDDYKYDEIYKLFDSYISWPIEFFTIFLLNNSIDPLQYMTSVPDYYLHNVDIDKIKIPHNIKSIGSFAFADCENLIEVEFPSNLEIICHNAFENSKLKKLDLSKCNKLIEIGESAFRNCTNLQHVFFPESLIAIRSNAFCNCPYLEEIYLPHGIKRISEYAFSHHYAGLKLIYNGSEEEWKNVKGWEYIKESDIEVICLD